YRTFLISSVIDDQPVAGLHAAEILQGNRVGDPVPDCCSVELQIVKRVRRRLSLEKVIHRSPWDSCWIFATWSDGASHTKLSVTGSRSHRLRRIYFGGCFSSSGFLSCCLSS